MDASATTLDNVPIGPGRWLLLYAASVFGLALVPVVLFFFVDPEQRTIDQSVRESVAGEFVRLSDGFTHYEIAGPAAGPVVVLVAGATVPYYIWDPTFAALTSAGYRVLRYDFYGRGYSDRPDIAYTQDMYVRQLAELLDALDVKDPVVLAGLSFGGSVITSVADRHPDRVRSLVYVDPAFRTPQFVSPIAARPRLWSFVTGLVDERWWARSQLDDFLHPERFPDWPDRYREQLQYRGFRRARLSDLVSNADFDQQAELERVGKNPRPVLAIWGRQDQNVPFEFSLAFLEAIPHARLVPVDQAGHLPQWEQPKIVNDAIIAFLGGTRS
jgi:pimeloyl-ACP methyl ester carboxylesterase